MNNFRVCRCGCGQRMTIFIHFKKPVKVLERKIKCGYCGDLVDQNNTSYRTGKWFHDQCISDYKNLKASLESKPHIGMRTELVQAFRDFVLYRMIERKDLRLLHQHWIKIASEKAVPLMMKDLAKKKQTIQLNRNFIYHYQHGDPLAIFVGQSSQAKTGS